MTQAKEGGTKGRMLVIGLLGTMFALLGFVFWIGVTGDKDPNARMVGANATRKPGEGQNAPAPGLPGSVEPGAAVDGGPIGKLANDRRARDELRRKILAAWAAGDGETAAAAREGRVPDHASDGKPLDKDYIRGVFREDFVPMAKQCYEELLTRRDAAAGRIDIKLKIIGDEKLGGLVEDADVEHDDGGGGLGDERFTTCIRESTMSLTFKPPPNGGTTTVTYPIELSP